MFSEKIKDSLSALTKFSNCRQYIFTLLHRVLRGVAWELPTNSRDLTSEIGSCPVRAAINYVQLCQTKASFQRRRSQSFIPK